MTVRAKGGDDILTGGENSLQNTLFGDAQIWNGSAEGGDDRLVDASNTTDYMWGDFQTSDGPVKGGADTFILSPDSGEDHIYDFRQGEDTIELSGFASGTQFEDLDIQAVDADRDGSLDSAIRFGANDSVTVHGVTELVASDFTFVDFVA
jgi:hypothetical protein